MSAAYFDVDGTLVRINLLPPTLRFLANQATPLRSALSISKIFFDAPLLLASELQDRRVFNERLFSHFRGLSEDRLEVLSEEVFEDVVKPNLYRGARDLIAQVKQAGQRVVLITGSLDLTIRPLARYLGADSWIANRLEIKDGYATGKLLRPVVAGPIKARLIVEDARAHGDDLADCHAYSDSASDLPMLSVVGHPFCVRPDSGLERIARAYAWPVLDIDTPSPGSARSDGAHS